MWSAVPIRRLLSHMCLVVTHVSMSHRTFPLLPHHLPRSPNSHPQCPFSPPEMQPVTKHHLNNIQAPKLCAPHGGSGLPLPTSLSASSTMPTSLPENSFSFLPPFIAKTDGPKSPQTDSSGGTGERDGETRCSHLDAILCTMGHVMKFVQELINMTPPHRNVLKILPTAPSSH